MVLLVAQGREMVNEELAHLFQILAEKCYVVDSHKFRFIKHKVKHFCRYCLRADMESGQSQFHCETLPSGLRRSGQRLAAVPRPGFAFSLADKLTDS